MKHIFMKLIGLLCIALFLNGCNSEDDSSGVQNVEQTLVFIDPIVEERGLKANYLKAFNTLVFNGFSHSYSFTSKHYNNAEKLAKINLKTVNDLSIKEIKSDYDILMLSFKAKNYQKLEEQNDISLTGYKPVKDEVDNKVSQHKTMIILVGQLHNELLRKTADKEGLLGSKLIDLSDSVAITTIEKDLNKLILNNEDLIKIIDTKYLLLKYILDRSSSDFTKSLYSHLGNDLIKLRINSMGKDDPKLAEVQKQLEYVLHIKENTKQYLEYIYQ